MSLDAFHSLRAFFDMNISWPKPSCPARIVLQKPVLGYWTSILQPFSPKKRDLG